MIPYESLVPYRRRTLAECMHIIDLVVNPEGHTWTPMKENESTLHQSWIDACLNESKKRLTKWEEDFLTSIQDDLTNRGFLTEGQAQTLERIYTEKT